jgi:ribonuclease BN (tRNA processing enzyme)
MKLTILGSGTSHIRDNQHQSAYLLEHNKKFMLLDAGAGTVYQLANLGIPPTKIDYIFFSHFHNDHISDLPAILWSNNWHRPPKTDKLTVYGPDGMKEYVEVLMTKLLIHGRKDKARYSIKFDLEAHDVTNKSFEAEGLKITTKELKHYGNIAYRIEYKGKILVYSGDTNYCDELVEISKGATVSLMECGMPDDNPKHHMTPTQCGEAAYKAIVKTLVLTHFYPELDNVDIVSVVRRKFKGKIVLAKDLMEIPI